MGDDDKTPSKREAQTPTVAPRVRRRLDQTSDDTDRGWGEGPGAEDDHDRWLREQRPPHWE